MYIHLSTALKKHSRRRRCLLLLLNRAPLPPEIRFDFCFVFDDQSKNVLFSSFPSIRAPTGNERYSRDGFRSLLLYTARNLSSGERSDCKRGGD